MNSKYCNIKSLIKQFCIIITIICSASICLASETKLKQGFIYLDQVSPSIKVNIRYATNNNFLMKPLDGMEHNRAVLTNEAANALDNVQEDLLLRGYSLVLYSAYMPLKAVNQMQEDLNSGVSNNLKQLYFPNLSEQEVLSQGYIKEKQDNIRGSTVDVSIIPLNKKIKNKFFIRKRSYSNVRNMYFLDDGSSDMGTSYDTFDPLSCHECGRVTQEVQHNRQLLKEVMESHGFKASNLVWWKYTYIREPFPDSSFDFNI